MKKSKGQRLDGKRVVGGEWWKLLDWGEYAKEKAEEWILEGLLV